MGTETERKFLVAGDGWRAGATAGRHIRQAYLARGATAQVRLRIVDGESAVLTVKSASPGLSRAEYEYALPVGEAEAMLALCEEEPLAKRRHRVPAGDGLTWEVDVFEGPLAGLVLAEIELDDPQQAFTRPEWLGREVTGEQAYYNAALARDGLPRG